MNTHTSHTITHNHVSTQRNAIVKIPYSSAIGVSYYNDKNFNILSTDKPNDTDIVGVYTPIKTHMNINLPAIYTFSIYNNEVYFPQLNTTYRNFNNYFSQEAILVDPKIMYGKMAITWNRQYGYNEISMLYSDDREDTTEDNITYTSIGLYNSIEQVIFNDEIVPLNHEYARVLDDQVAILPQNYHLSYQHPMLHEYMARFTHNMIIRIGTKIPHGTNNMLNQQIYTETGQLRTVARHNIHQQYTFQPIGNAENMIGIRVGSIIQVDTNDTFYDNRTRTTFVRLINHNAIINYNHPSTQHVGSNEIYYIPIYTDSCISSSLQIL